MKVYAENVGVQGPPEPQGYEPLPDTDPLGDGTPVYCCRDCGAIWNADELHGDDCPRKAVDRTEPRYCLAHREFKTDYDDCCGCDAHEGDDNCDLRVLVRVRRREAEQAVIEAASYILNALDRVSDVDRERLESLDSPLVEPAVGALRLAFQRAGAVASVEAPAGPRDGVVARLIAAAESHADGNPGDGCWAFAGWVAALIAGEGVPDFSALTQAEGEALSDRSGDLIRAALAAAPTTTTEEANA